MMIGLLHMSNIFDSVSTLARSLYLVAAISWINPLPTLTIDTCFALSYGSRNQGLD